MGILLALALPGAAAAIWARRVSVDGRTPFADLGLGLAVALGAASVIWAALLFGGLPSRRAILIADGAVWLAAVAALWRWSPTCQDPAPTPPTAGWWPGALVLIPIVAICTLSFVAASAVAPHGNWDACPERRLGVRVWKPLHRGRWHNRLPARVKLIVNRLVNFGIRVLFRTPLNDTTNAFKAYGEP